MAAVADNKGGIKIRDMIRKVNIKEYKAHRDPVYGLDFINGTTSVLSSGDDLVIFF